MPDRDWRGDVRRVLADVPHDRAKTEEIVAELGHHLEDRYRQSLSEGHTEAEAHDRALDELADAQALLEELARKEPSRTTTVGQRGGGLMSGMWQDWCHAWRLLRKDPWFAAAGALTLALGIGANGAIFSVVHAVLLRPLPYRAPNELVMVWESRPREGVSDNVVSPADFLDWRTRQQVFEDIAAQQSISLNVTGSGEPDRLNAGNVSTSFFRVLGVVPALGRDFRSDDEQSGRNRVVILNHGFWQRRFGGDPHVVGTRVTLDGQPYEIIGVLPSSFRFPDDSIELWFPIDFSLERNRARFNHFLSVFARMKNGVTVERAQRDMDAIAAQLQREVELQNQGHGARVMPLRDQLVGGVQPSLVILMAAVTFLLLIACVNVANLLLVRGAARRKEIALRAALGAGRVRIARQFVLECVALAALATVIALPISLWATRVLKSFVPIEIPRLNEAGLNLTVIGFMVCVAGVAAIVFSLAPIWQVSTLDLNAAINEGGVNAGRSRRRTRRALVVAEIALAFVLLIAAGLMTRTLVNLLTVDPGFISQNVATIPLTLVATEDPALEDSTVALRELLDSLRAQPGVDSAGYTSHLPMSGIDSRQGIGVEGRAPTPGEPARAHWRVVTPGYFAAMQIRLARGRFPTDAEAQGRAPVAVINRTAAERYWHGLDPIGKRLRIVTPEWREIIGVVDDVRHWGTASAVNPEVYLPGYRNPATLVVRGHQGAAALSSTIREQVRRLSPSLPLASLRTMDDIRGESVASPRFHVLLLAVFGAVALVLAVTGVYGLVSYSVAQSRRDIGIRMAVGACRKDVVGLFLGEGLVLTAVGLALGAVGAFAVTRLLAGLLYGVTPTDAVTFAAVAALMGLVAVVAAYVPARRSAAVDPLLALRHE